MVLNAMANSVEIWQDVAARLQTKVGGETYETWFAGILPVEITPQHCRLGVRNGVFSDWLSANYRDVIAECLTDVLGQAPDISFVTGFTPPPGAVASDATDGAPPTATPAALAAPSPAPGASPGRLHEPLDDQQSLAAYNRRFTFDTFVVGENNRFAHAACQAVARNLGNAYNPLFIYGLTGLGKTHLLQAVATVVLARKPHARIEYISSEDFFNRFIEALGERSLPTFRQLYRNTDLLLFDDVHFFTGKEGLQEEFFHTFNALYNAHRQIVLTSDRPPSEIGGLEKRLVSRFEWGLTTEILPPDFETRMAILHKKQAEHRIKVSDELLQWIAHRIKSNIRRLEGALIRLVSYSSIHSVPITKSIAESLLAPLLDEETGSMLTIEQIQKVVAEHYDIRVADMTSPKRPRNIAFPRQIAMALCRKHTDSSSPTVARAFDRNHATVLHAEAKIQKELKKDEEFARTFHTIEKKLKALTTN